MKLSLEEGELQGGWFVVIYRNENARGALVVWNKVTASAREEMPGNASLDVYLQRDV